MNKKIAVVFLMVSALLAVSIGSAWAQTVPQLNRPNEWRERNTFRSTVIARGAVDLTNATVAMNEGQIPLDYIADAFRYAQLPVTSFVLTTGTAPVIAFVDGLPTIVKVAAHTTPSVVSFKVPHDYRWGGWFRVLATQSGTSTACEIDFDVLVNKAARPAATPTEARTPRAMNAWKARLSSMSTAAPNHRSATNDRASNTSLMAATGPSGLVGTPGTRSTASTRSETP